MSDEITTTATRNYSANPDWQDAQAIIQAARESADPYEIDRGDDGTTTAFVVPAGASLRVVNPDESLLSAPRRLKGTVRVQDLASFKLYVSEYFPTGQAGTTIWVNPDGPAITAVLNDAHADTSAWRDHQCVLPITRTPEWLRWVALDKRLVDQQTFAEHIEISELDIKTPSAADVLEIAQTFEAKRDVDFRSAARLQDGNVQFKWVETTTAKAGQNGELAIPAKLELQVAPFIGEQPVAVDALLRYRLTDGNLKIGYQLVRPEDVERTAIALMRTDLATDFPRTYLGTPAA